MLDTATEPLGQLDLIATATPAVHEDRAPENGMLAYSLINAIVSQRNAALARHHEAHLAVTAALESMATARKAITDAAAHTRIDANRTLGGTRTGQLLIQASTVDEETFARESRRNIDAAVWRRIMDQTHLHELMDHTAKEALRNQIDDDPPEVTVDNVRATLESLLADARHIFLRGIATCFSKLDRRFRSHDGFKIGSKIILDNVFDEYGLWRYHSPHKDLLADIDRTLRRLDDAPGTPPPLVDALESERKRWRMNPEATTIEHPYSRIRTYKNGNCHLLFKREDLILRVNQLLREYYGEVLGDGSNQRREHARDAAARPGTTMARNFGFFPTPPEVVKIVMRHARITRHDPPLSVLEPNAGTGPLARAAADAGAEVDCVEIQSALAEALAHEGCYRAVTTTDFLQHRATPARRYDRIVMNPPFDRGLDIAHVEHALQFLKTDGMLLAIMSAGTEFRETRQARHFRSTMQRLNARWIDLPDGAFIPSGTHVNTVLLIANADATPSRPRH